MLAIPFSSGARARTGLVAPLLLLLAALLSGCAEPARMTASTNAFPTGSPFGGSQNDGSDDAMRGSLVRGTYSYPLAIGNRWDYLLEARVEVFPDRGDPSAWQERAYWSEEVLDAGTYDGRVYFRLVYGDPTMGPLSPWILQRQDESGLYEYDSGISMLPASRAPGNSPFSVSRAAHAAAERSLAGSDRGAAFARAAAASLAKLERMQQEFLGREGATTEPSPNELSLLRYPLRVGASWLVRPSPEFAREVVGMEEMVLPVGRVRAWRLRGSSELFGSEDQVSFWYGRAGLVRIHLHSVMNATDLSGNVIGKAVSEYDRSLLHAKLDGAPGPTK